MSFHLFDESLQKTYCVPGIRPQAGDTGVRDQGHRSLSKEKTDFNLIITQVSITYPEEEIQREHIPENFPKGGNELRCEGQGAGWRSSARAMWAGWAPEGLSPPVRPVGSGQVIPAPQICFFISEAEMEPTTRFFLSLHELAVHNCINQAT